MFRRAFALLVIAAVLAGCVQSALPASEGAQNLPAAQQQEPAAPGLTTSKQQIAASSIVTEEATTEETAATQQEVPTAVPASPTSAPTELTAVETTEPVAQVEAPNAPSQAVSPLTGLPVQNADALSYAPALVSITNFPVRARPQAGLSFSPFVFELYIGEGMTRFLALFHGDYPERGEDANVTLDDDKIGPVRSGRLPFEDLRSLYNGFLIMASASANVRSNLSAYTNVWGSDTGDINSAMIPVTKLEEIAAATPDRVDEGGLSGLEFSGTAPENGKNAQKVWIPFSFLNQVIWQYDNASGAYHRYQDNADGKTFIQATDRLNGEPLTYENVVVLFANHQAPAETLINIDLLYIDRMPALLFRDGKMYEIFWTTANGDYEKQTGKLRPIRFIDANGDPFPLKPGQTWVEIVQPYTRYNETVDSELYFDLKRRVEPGSGVWAVHFYPTVPEK